MAELTFKSAGVSTREIDLTGPTANEPKGTPAGVISPTLKGPAFVPITVPTDQDYAVIFGNPATNYKLGPLSAIEWLNTQQALTQIRLLGVGDASQRTSAGNNTGKVTSAGFVVGDYQPQNSVSGALGSNPYATNLSTGATGSNGRAYLLGCVMSQSTNSTFFTDAGLSAAGTPIVRGLVMAASGVILRLSNSYTASAAPSSAVAADFSAGNIQGSLTGSTRLTGGLQEFVMLLNGHKGTDSQYPNVLTASFDPTAPNYFANIFNRDPLKMEQAGHFLYTHHDIHSAVAVPTGSSVVIVSSGSAGSGNGYENIAFLMTGSQGYNSGSTTAPNFENFEDRFRTPVTPWIVSQNFGGRPLNLFKVWALSDGEYANDKIKISIENISPSNSDVSQFGTFDLVVRDFNDTDAKKVVLEQWRGLTLNPESDKYIAKVIGDLKVFYNFDTGTSAQKLEVTGQYRNMSRYIRVEMSDAVTAGAVAESSLPFGFRGPQHLVTSGTAPTPSFSDSNYYTVANLLQRMVQPPVPMRLSLQKGTGTAATADKSLYWGVQFEFVTSAAEPNYSTAPNRSLSSYTKYFPNFHTDWMNVVAFDNEGDADTTANGIIDADRFNNNLFTLEKIQVKYNSTTLLPDLANLKDWRYVRSGSIATDTVNLTRGLTMSDLLDPSVRSVAKFTTYLQGGFDGVRAFNSDTRYMTNNAVVEEMNNSNRGFSSGPTVKSYLKGIDIIKDTTEVDIQLLAIPGMRHRFVTDTAATAIETDRFDAVYIMDIEERDVGNQVVSGSSQNVSVRNTSNDFRSRGLNTSYTAAYFPDVVIRDKFNNTVERVAPSVAVLGAFGKNDAIGYSWFAPAGFNRASLDSVQETAIQVSRANLDDLYSVRINPIATFSGKSPSVWGQKTLLAGESSLESINVRRLLLSLRREVKKVGHLIQFEPNLQATLDRFQSLVNPILKRVQSKGGISNYKVKIDTSTTTEADIANGIIKGEIYIVPTKAVEFISIDFVVQNTAV